MLADFLDKGDVSVVLCSFSGALVYMFSQKIRVNSKLKNTLLFMISFLMGIFGADVLLVILNQHFHGLFHNQKAIAAFICSAMIIIVINNLIKKYDS